MKIKEKKWIRFRIYLVAFFFLCGMGTVLARAYQLQVLEKDRLTSIARAGYRGKVKLPSKRGTVYDREGHELAVSVEVESIYAHPRLVKKKSDTARQLSRLLHERYRKILPLLKSKRAFVWIKRKVTPEKVKRVRTLGLKGIGFVTETRRYYPGKEIAAHLIGFVGDDNQGLEGLERKYDSILKGPEYTFIQMRDALGRPFSISRPISFDHVAHDLVLTIDKDIQYKTQQALNLGVEKARAKSGQCIVLNPETGEVLAMAVVPSYNPNIFSKYRPYQWRNRTVTDIYEPGSTIKAFLLAAALDKNLVSPQTRFDCEQGNFRVAGHIIHDTKPHGVMSVSEIITLSSNIGAVKIGQKLGYKRFRDYLSRFGFGLKTGIDLIGERKGFLRPVKRARELDRTTIFFGQGMSATSLQIAVAMAAIANGGKLMRPFVIKKVMDQDGRVIKENYPHMVRRIIPSGVARKVRTILEGVVSKKGTGPRAAIRGYRAGGKTGTSQKVDPKTKKYSNKAYVALFVGFVPVDDPKLVILVAIDEPKGSVYGGVVAGPVFSKVGGWALNHLRINPKRNMTRLAWIPRSNSSSIPRPESVHEVRPEVSGLLPDFRGKSIREVLKRGRDLGLQVVPEGSGLAFKQVPRPGIPIGRIKTVKVSFRPPT